jgi:hypothetical protein
LNRCSLAGARAFGFVIQGELVGVSGEQLHELGMNEKLFPPGLHFLEYADLCKVLEVFRSGFAMGQLRFDEVLNSIFLA